MRERCDRCGGIDCGDIDCKQELLAVLVGRFGARHSPRHPSEIQIRQARRASAGSVVKVSGVRVERATIPSHHWLIYVMCRSGGG